MRALMFAARMRGADSAEEALAWMEGRGYITRKVEGEIHLTSAGVQRAANIHSPKLDMEAMGLLQRWTRAMRTAQADGEEVPVPGDTEAVVEWLVANDQIVPPTTVQRAQEIVEDGLLSFYRGRV